MAAAAHAALPVGIGRLRAHALVVVGGASADAAVVAARRRGTGGAGPSYELLNLEQLALVNLLT